MNILEQEQKLGQNIFLDKLTSEKEVIKSSRNSLNSDFNLEYQIYKYPPDNHTKFTKEFQKLVQFVKESNLYRDINGNRIIKKGKLLLTPFQRIKKINEEIKTYYVNRQNKKKSQLIIKNFNAKEDEIYKNFEFNSERRKIIPIYGKNNINNMRENNKKLKYKTMNKLSLKLNINSNTNKNLKPIINNKSNTINFKNFQNFLYLTNTAKNSRTKYFDDSKFNQINFWKTKIIKLDSLNNTNFKDNSNIKFYKNKKSITEYNNKNKINTPNRKTINIKKINRNKLLIESKTIEEDNLDKCNYKLIKFNLHQLIKPSQKYKDKIVLNTKTFMTDLKSSDKNEEKNIDNNINNNIKMENKIIGVNMDESESKGQQ